MTCDLTCDSVTELARQRKRLPCRRASHANAGTESLVELQVITQDFLFYYYNTCSPVLPKICLCFVVNVAMTFPHLAKGQ
jgi:hypothetical protein